MKPNLERPKSLSLMLRRSVPKLFLILTAGVPAIAIPSIVIARSKEGSLKYVEAECVGSKSTERMSKNGRYVAGDKKNSRFSHLIGEMDLQEPVQQIIVNETAGSGKKSEEEPLYVIEPQNGVPIPEIKTYEQVLEEEKLWQKSVPSLDTPSDHLNKIPTPPSEINLERGHPSCLNESDQEIAILDSTTQPEDKESEESTNAANPKSILKIFPLRPEKYGQTIREKLEKGQVTTPQVDQSANQNRSNSRYPTESRIAPQVPTQNSLGQQENTPSLNQQEPDNNLPAPVDQRAIEPSTSLPSEAEQRAIESQAAKLPAKIDQRAVEARPSTGLPSEAEPRAAETQAANLPAKIDQRAVEARPSTSLPSEAEQRAAETQAGKLPAQIDQRAVEARPSTSLPSEAEPRAAETQAAKLPAQIDQRAVEARPSTSLPTEADQRAAESQAAKLPAQIDQRAVEARPSTSLPSEAEPRAAETQAGKLPAQIDQRAVEARPSTSLPSETEQRAAETQAGKLPAQIDQQAVEARPSTIEQRINPPTQNIEQFNAPQPLAPAQTEPPITIVQNPQNGPVAVPPTPSNNQGYLANYSNLDIKEFIRFISRITNKNFIFNETDLNFTISMISERKSTPDELIATLMQQLRIHGLAVIEEGDSFIIHTNPEVNAPATVLPRSPGEYVPSDVQIITQVFRLNIIAPSQAVSILKPLLSAQAVIEPLDDAGILTLTDLKINVDKVKDLLVQLDIPSSGLDVSHFRSEFINAETLAALGQKVLAPIADGKEIRLIPLTDSNSIFIISTPILVRRAVEFFTALDKEIRYNTGKVPGFNSNALSQGGSNKEAIERDFEKEQAINDSLRQPLEDLNNTIQSSTSQTRSSITEFDYYKLEYRKGDQIQQALSQIGDSINKGQGAQDANNDLSNAIATVQWIEASNTMIFTGTPSANAKIKQLISDLDTPNQQVLIEMLLLDTSIDKSYRFGVDWGTRFGGPNAAGSQAFLSPQSPLPSTLDANLAPDFLNAQQLARTAGFTLGVIGRTISCDGLTFSNLGALITAIHTEDIGKVILNPKIVVEENNTAEIFVGLNVPFKTQSVANDFGTILTNNFQYRDIGARMTVTPIINRNGIITLEIEQELSTLIDSSTSVITNSFFQISSAAIGAGPTTRKSNSKTTVFVPNGHFVIMSGMIQDESERIRTQVPCLGGVPVLGGAFSQKNNREQNRNLMIFIRPSLINTEDEMTYFTKREQDIYDQKNHAKDLWKYEIEEALDFLNINPDSCCK